MMMSIDDLATTLNICCFNHVFNLTQLSDVNKDLTLKAKDKDKDQTPKDKDKDQTFKAKDQDKD